MNPSDEPFRPREIWPPGTVIKGDYVIQYKIGGGGFGMVYLAKHRLLETFHVIKRLHEHFASDPEYVRKFINEARVVRRLRNRPNVVEVEHMTQSEDGHLILVMEYINGGDLAGLMESRPLGVEEIVEYSRQIATGLAAAHGAGLVHRDIKPQNVMLGKDSAGRSLLKLIDFGIAADHMNQQQTSVMRGGSIGYSAPEQWIKAGKELDGRTDLYSLGATMYRLLCGRMPYEAVNIVDWTEQVKRGPPVPPSRLRAEVLHPLSALILELLAFRREDRPSDAAAVIQRLADLRPSDAPISGPPTRTVTMRGSELVLPDSLPGVSPGPRSPVRGDIWINPKDGLPYVYIPPGVFRMGANDGHANEKPVHEVTISTGFWIGQTAVTVGAFKRYVRSTGKSMPDEPMFINKNLNPNWSSESLPMTMVSWTDARDYADWAGLRLPTEAEWEYAARVGTTGARYGEVDAIAWHEGNSGGQPHEVGRKRPNEFELFDMLGNVLEWTADWYGDNYESEKAVSDPKGPLSGTSRVLRGASWLFSSTNVRSSFRTKDPPMWGFIYYGFRCSGTTPAS